MSTSRSQQQATSQRSSQPLSSPTKGSASQRASTTVSSSNASTRKRKSTSDGAESQEDSKHSKGSKQTKGSASKRTTLSSTVADRSPSPSYSPSPFSPFSLSLSLTPSPMPLPPPLVPQAKLKQQRSDDKQMKAESDHKEAINKNGKMQSVKEEDSDVEMKDVEEEMRSEAPAPSSRRGRSGFSLEDEAAEQKESRPAADNDDDSEDEDTGSDPSKDLFYQPALSAHAEKVDPSDPFSSVHHRATRMIQQLSPDFLPSSLPGLESKQEELYDLLTRIMISSQNHAALILGPPGSGKNVLLETCFAQLRAEYYPKGKNFVLIRLNGLIQTDDTLAMREIVHQICEDHEIEMVSTGNRMDFHAHLAFLIDILNAGHFNGIPLFFILDHFESFTHRPKQTLLYNLCDLLQNENVQIGIIGITTNLDVFERLEKRIRSRMSHRRIIIGKPQLQTTTQQQQQSEKDSTPYPTFQKEKSHNTLAGENIIKILRERLQIVEPEPDASSTHKREEEKSSIKPQKKLPSSHLSIHNTSINKLLDRKSSPKLFAALVGLMSAQKPVSFILRCFQMAITVALNDRHTQLTEADVLWAIDYTRRDYLMDTLRRCSILELTLLASLLSLSRRRLSHQNFHLIYNSIHNMLQSQPPALAKSIYLPPEETIFKCFEQMIAKQELIGWVDTNAANSLINAADPTDTGRAIQRRFNPVRMLLSPEELKRAFKEKVVEAPTWLTQWVKKVD